MRLTFEFSLASGFALAMLFWSLGDFVIAFITTAPEIRSTASRFLPFAAVIPLIGMPSWMLDGVFIGATRGRALRNAGVLATVLYWATDLVLRPLGNFGVWFGPVLQLCVPRRVARTVRPFTAALARR